MRKKIEEKKWRDILSDISENVTEVSYRSWFAPLVPMEIDEDAAVIYFATSKKQIMEVLEMRYIPVFERAVESVYHKKYKVVVKNKTESEIQQQLNMGTTQIPSGNNPASAHTSGKPPISTPKPKAPALQEENELKEEYFLNPQYNFDNFIVGENNKYAHAVAYAVAESPASTYNPLFIYGNSGLGKTHLMQAIGNKIKANNPNAKIIYVSSENFMNEFITSIREKTGDKFRNKYRAADALLVDDVQFLKNKEATQDEFFHTFNELFNSKKQIVLTSDRLPNELKTLEDRLRTRFGQGLTIDVSVPNFETRVAILQQKALEHNKEIDEDALLYVAEHIRSSVRELEGALLKIISMSEFKKCKITKDFAEEVLKKLIPKSETVTPQNIIKKVSTYYNISESDITGKVKTKEIVVPRQISMYLCRKILNMNDTNIGKEFGKDRTTVGHNIEKIEESIDTNSTIKSDVNYILKDLNYNEG